MKPHKFEEVKIPLSCAKICGRWYGTQQERPILALHGWGDNAGSFALLAPLLAKNIPILAIDYPGHGLSSCFPNGIKYNFLDYIKIVREIMIYYKWPKLSLMGHSMGAGIAFLFAAMFPGDVDIIISIDGFEVRRFKPKEQIKCINYSTEGYCRENEVRMEFEKHKVQPALYSYEQLENMIYNATGKSVKLSNAKYLLERKIKPSTHDPNLYYLIGDKRIKYMEHFIVGENEDALTSRIEGVKWLILKSETSSSPINIQKFLQLAEILQYKNKLLEFYSIPNTTHHLHLNNADQVAGYIERFLLTNRKAEIIKIDGKL